MVLRSHNGEISSSISRSKSPYLIKNISRVNSSRFFGPSAGNLMPHVEFGLSITKINDDIPLLQIQYKHIQLKIMIIEYQERIKLVVVKHRT